MSTHGRGLNREIVAAVNRGEISEPFNLAKVRDYVSEKGWDVPEKYLRVCLANGTATDHSLTYRKYFEALGDGKYRVGKLYRGPSWW